MKGSHLCEYLQEENARHCHREQVQSARDQNGLCVFRVQKEANGAGSGWIRLELGISWVKGHN